MVVCREDRRGCDRLGCCRPAEAAVDELHNAGVEVLASLLSRHRLNPAHKFHAPFLHTTEPVGLRPRRIFD